MKKIEKINNIENDGWQIFYKLNELVDAVNMLLMPPRKKGKPRKSFDAMMGNPMEKLNKLVKNTTKKRKFIGWVHKRPARSNDWACDECGGDIRDVCCTKETCDPIYEDEDTTKEKS